MDNDAIRDEASRILSDKDYQQYQPQQSDVLAPFWKWLRDLLDFGPPPETPQGSFPFWEVFALLIKVVVVLLILFGICMGIYALVQRFTHRDETVPLVGVSHQQRVESRESYVRQAEEAFRAGDYRLAMHMLLMAAVTMVIKDSSFHSAEFLTNRELAAASDFSGHRGGAELNRMLHDMVRYDEPCWFGRATADEPGFQNFRKVYDQFQTSLGGRRG